MSWFATASSGPGPGQPSSIVWWYHAHVDPAIEINSGLLGPIIVTAKGKAKPDGSPKDVDREIIALFAAFNENDSWYVDENVAAHISSADRKALGDGNANANFSDAQGYFTFAGTGFAETNSARLSTNSAQNRPLDAS